MMKVLIVDDEKNARAALKGMINSNFPKEITIVDEVTNVPDAVKSIHKHKPDVVLLDIEMPGYLGIDLLDFFDPKDVSFKIIFITAYNDYALKAFDLAAVDYLLKPTRVDQLKRAFDRAKESLAQQGSQDNYFALKENLDNRNLSKIALQTSDGIMVVDINDIRMMRADGAYTHICFTNDERITASKNLQGYQSLEETGQFFRVNRSYIININRIVKISKKDGGFVEMDNGEEISVSAEKRILLQKQFKGKIY